MTTVPAGELSPLWIDRAEDVEALTRSLRTSSLVALDTEADSFHSYHHKLCLVQLSSGGTHALLDPLRLGVNGLAPLAEVLADRDRLKILHGADYDLRILDRDLGVRVRGLADTHAAAQLLGERHTGLASLLERELGVHLSKELQRADWSVRPLSAAHRAYAAADTAFLEALLERLLSRLRALGRLAWWEEECRALEEVRYEPSPPDPFAFERLKGAKALRGAARDRLAALHAWREGVAAAADVAPYKVMGRDTMLRLAQEAPADMAALAATAGVGRATVRRHGLALLQLLREPPPAPQRERLPRPAVDREFEARLKVARARRDERARILDLEPGVLAPRERLEEVVRALPAHEDALAECLGRRWRAAALAADLLPLTTEWRATLTSSDACPA
ncbi:MAG: ribonuclease D [Acidobacteriota bacterium]|jgi:ribonuclease D